MRKPLQTGARNPERQQRKCRTYSTERSRTEVSSYYRTLYSGMGAQHWWPAESMFEVVVGAYLTQNTAWKNVEMALGRLREADSLSMEAIRKIELSALERLIRPAGYFRQKAARLKRFVAYVDERHGGSLERMFEKGTDELRLELLALNGVGPETADSILLYAGQHEVFVVDAYTRRIFERHRVVERGVAYEEIRDLVESALAGEVGQEDAGEGCARMPAPPVHAPTVMSEMPRSERAQRYNEFHGLLVQVGKHLCQSREAKCHLCPLARFLPANGPAMDQTKKKAGSIRPGE